MKLQLQFIFCCLFFISSISTAVNTVNAGDHPANHLELTKNAKATTAITSTSDERIADCTLGDFTFNTQAQIDQFGIDYAHCTNIALNNVTIKKNNFYSSITNLDGLANVTSIGGNILIEDNNGLTTLNGLAPETGYEVYVRQICGSNTSDWESLSFTTLPPQALYAFGAGAQGRLGTGNTSQQNSPVQIGTDEWLHISAGSDHSLGIKADGTLWAWGWGGFGRLGTGNTSTQFSPVQIGTDEWQQISAGSNHSLGIKADGTLWAWGAGANGQLGTGNTSDEHSPVQIGTDEWQHITAGYYHSLGIKADGTLWAWGNGGNGQLGTGNTSSQFSPVQIGTDEWQHITAGGDHSLGIKADGTLWAWGYGGDGRLGTGNTSQQNSPVQIGTDEWQHITAGYYHSLGIKADGTLWAWGYGGNGQLGTGNTSSQFSPVQIGTDEWQHISAGDFHSLGIKADGTLWAWGWGFYGQLGTENTSDEHSPVQIGTAPLYAMVAAGAAHSLVLGDFPPCDAPTDLALDNVTTDSVDLSWTAGDTETEWEISYGAPNFDPNTEGTTETVNDDPEFTLDGLTAETDYEVYVRAVCGVDDESDWVGPESFTTNSYIPSSSILYVNKNAGGNGDGSSWANAIPELADALVWAKNNESSWATTPLKIFVAIGTYKPLYSPADSDFGTNQGRDNSFSMVNNVQIYGGFDPSNNITTLNDTRILPTSGATGSILSADVNDDDGSGFTNISENLIRVVVSSGDVGEALLNGFTISGANGEYNDDITVNGNPIYQCSGAGIYNSISSPVYENLLLQGNFNTESGGGMFSYQSSPKLSNIVFKGNKAKDGGAIASQDNSNPTLINILFVDNIATSDGGAIYNVTNSSPTFVNTTVVNNSDTNGNNGMHNEGTSSPIIHNSIVWGGITGNYQAQNSIIENSSDTNNNNIDATSYTETDIFNDPANGDYTLKLNSPAVNSGSNILYTNAGGNISTDLDLTGNPRLSATTIDIGAFEFINPCPAPTAFALDNVTTESVDLTWTAGDTEAVWEVNYGAPNFDPNTEGTTETVNDDPEFTLDGLTTETDYEVYVRAVCGADDESDWVGPLSLTTLSDLVCTGDNWTAHTAAENNDWRSITYGNGKFVAVSDSGINRVMTSPDGETWTAYPAAENSEWLSVTYGNGKFVAVAGWGTNRVMTSPDGENWTAHPAAENNNWRSITYGNGKFVAVAADGTNRVMTSTDGENWMVHAAAENNKWFSVTYANGKFVAVAVDGTNRVMTSTDGENWTAHFAAENNEWFSVTYGNGKFVAVAITGANRVMSSPDGENWTAHPATGNYFWFSVTYGNGKFVAVAITGTNQVMSSPDGETWTAHPAAENNYWNSVTYGNGKFVAVSYNGTNRVMVSSCEPPCPAPTAFALDNVTTESVDLTWTAGDTEAVWEVNYGAPNFDPNTEGTTETVNDDPGFTLDGLTAETDYEVYVRAVCGVDDESDWVGPESFTTLVACPTGDFTFTSQAQIDDFGTTYSHCTDITLGNITIQGNDITNVDGLSNVTSTTGNLIVQYNSQLTDITGFANITSIGGNLKFEGNTAITSLSGFAGLETVGGFLSLWNNSMTTLQGLNQLTTVGGYLQIFSNPLLEDFDGINALTAIGGNFYAEQNTVLENMNGLANLTAIGGFIYVTYNNALTDISGLQNIDPETIGGYLGLYITNNTNLSVCNLPNFCTYLLGSGNRTISGNLAECLNEAAVQAACGAELPFNQTQEIYTLTIQDAVEASDCDVQSTVVIPSGDYTTETVDTTAPCWDIFFTVGASPGCATIGSVTLDGSDTIEIEIEGLTACTEYDQYEITNDLTLGGATLDVEFLNGYEPDFEDSWIIYNNTFINAVNGTFAGLAEGATFTVDGFEMQISYVGGDGNDIVLTATDCPDITTTDVETNQEEDIVADCEYEFTWTEPTFTGGCGITVTRVLDPVYAVSDPYVAGQVVTATTSVGITTVTYTAEDDSGNEEVFEFTLTANDVEDPEITCIIDQTVNTDLDECTYTHNNITWDATADDNCSVASIEYALTGATTGNGTSLDGVEFNLGETMVTWTVTDGSDNEVECSFTVTVKDNQDPEITCIIDQTVNTDLGECTYIHNNITWDATADDNCSVASIEYVLTGDTTGNGTSLDGVEFNLGTTTVTWTVIDGSDNEVECSFTVTVEDNQDPEITCIIDQTVNTDLDECTYTHNNITWDATADDNCSVASIEYVLTGDTTGNGTSLDGVEFNLGTTTVTWTVIDGSDNEVECSFTVTVEDNQDPEITCIIDQTVNTDLGECTYIHNNITWDATADDNCSVASIEYVLTGDTTGNGTSLDGVEFNLGTTTVTWTVIDGSDNEVECSFTVTVEDNQDPEITCIIDQTVNTDLDECTYTHNNITWDATATDNCSINAITYTLSGATTGNGTSLDGVVFNLGTTTVTWTATDGSTNTDVCSYTVTVEDNQDPEITCIANQTVDTDADVCTYTHSGTTWDATATDNCSADTIEYVLTGATTGNGTSLDGVVFNLGTTTVTWTATDGSTNTDVCSYTVTVEDNQDPDITCIANQTVDTDTDVCTYTHSGTTWDATATDNCSVDTIEYVLTGATTGNGTSLDGVVFNLGTTTVTWTATDGSTNTDVCSYTVTVEDNQNPEITCITNQTVDTDADVCTYTHSGTTWDATATDNCSVDTIEYVLTGDTTGNGTSLDGVVFNLGTTTVTWTATDGSSNTDVCSYTVTVEDNQDPDITCIANQTVDTDTNVCTYTHSGTTWDATATDNCSVDTIEYVLTGDTTGNGTSLDGVVFNLGTTTVTWTATDGSNNTDVCSYTVTVEDNQLPTAQCVADFTIQLDANGQASIEVSDINDGSFDNCGVDTVTISQSEFDCSHVGDNVVTLTVTDVNGNVSTCTTTVTVEDSIPPQMICPLDITAGTTPGSCGAQVFFGMPSVLDNCDGLVVPIQTAGLPSGSVFPLGETTITYTATDSQGNVASCSFTVTVEDTEAPMAVCQPVTLFLDENGQAVLDPAQLDGGSSDNCSTVLTYDASQTDFDCSHVGENTITLTVTDEAGNSSTCEAVVTIEDTTAPTAQCVAALTIQLDSNGQASIVVDDVNDGSFDNCTIDTIELSQTDFDCSHLGDNDIVLTVTDSSGNVSTCTTIVTVEDTIAPIVDCVDVTLPLDADGEAVLTPELVGGDSTDNCGIEVTAVDLEYFDCEDIGTPVSVTYFAMDSSGNISTCTAMVTVEDTLAPEIDCPEEAITIAEATYTVPDYYLDGIIDISDNCTVEEVTQAPAPGTVLDEGTYTIELTAIDASGNEATCSFEVIVDDGLDRPEYDIATLTMYPNPAANVVNISNPTGIGISSVAIYDLVGKRVQHLKPTASEVISVDVSELPSAVYMVQIIADNGQQLYKRLVKDAE